MITDKVRNTISKYHMIRENEHVVLGLSGGPDSVCLFFVLRQLGYVVHAVHVNHMMRRETADRDAEFVEKLCEKAGVECDVFSVDCLRKAEEEGISGEEAGREARYDAFTKVADRLSSQGLQVCIAVAHNADDQAETVLFRLLRGTGTDGLAAMEHVRTHGSYRLVRPLLDVARKEIEGYCAEQGIEFMTDESNLQPVYARNKIRLELLPLLREQYNSNITDGLRRLAAIAAADKEYLWKQTETACRDCLLEQNGSMVLDQHKVEELHPAIRSRVFLKCLQDLGLQEDVTRERLEAAEQMLHGDTSTKVVEFPHGYTITFAFGRIVIKGKNSREHVLIETELVDATDWRKTENQLYFDGAETAACSGIPEEKLAASVTVRSRQAGDYICLNSGTKKLKKLLGEMKIPADERDDLVVIAAGRCVLYVGTKNGSVKRYAETLRVTDKTERIITVKFV